MPARTKRLLATIVAAAWIVPAAAAAQDQGKDQLRAARDLYASARYDEALAVLNDIRPADSTNPVSDRRSVEQYRSLCLLALGRGAEAEAAIAAVVTSDPAYLPSENEASPRVRSAFSDVRKRLLPDIVTGRYAQAKAAFDRKDFPGATEQFRGVIALLDDPDMGGRLADLRVLAAGFLDLAVAATPPPPAPKPEPPPPPPAPKADPRRIYTAEDRDVTPPVPLRQEMPRLPQTLGAQVRDHGIVEIVIDEQGRVASVAMRQSVHPIYDNLVVTAAREWRYQAATFAGTPVKFRKMIQINISRHE